MNQRYPAVVLAIVVCIPLARGQTTGIITGDRVNLRSRPGPKGEVVAQLSKNTRVRVRSVQGDWLEVVPPQSVDLWVHSAFVSNGVVTVRTLNVRAGPSINYWVVGRLQK
ncbi:MAG TPA: SH3 domain-containing protein, partial [Lentisphaerae bacterium]|nr:SH3 domain-containing protein [Lentisphaerota bacterium]